jgi:outer membrane protein assembly factor BamB
MRTTIIIAALTLALGCGKKETSEPQGQAKAPPKPALPDSKKDQPKPTPTKKNPQPKPAPKVAVQKPGTVLWEFETGHQAGGPSIGNDGTVYVGSVDKKVYALDGQTGVKKWEFETGGMVISSPVIGPDNTVYVGSYDKKVYALNGKTGAKKWDFETGKPVASSPAIGADGIIYIGGWDGKVYALDAASGVKKWEFEIQNGLFSSPVVGFNNTVYAASVEVDGKNGVFCALDGKTGGKKWEHKAKKNVTTYAPTIGPAIASDNVVYLGISLDILGDEGKLIALDGKTGTVKWEFDLNCLPSPPVIGADKIIYFGTFREDGLIYSVDGKSGLKKWEYKLQEDAIYGAAQVIASPAIGDNGTIYIGANTGRKGEVLALNGKSGAKKWALKIGAINGIVIGNDGTIYVGSLNKKVYAIKTDSKGPAKSPWPMRGQNPQHSGRASAK